MTQITIEQVLDAIPSNWCDSLLTGPTGIGTPPYNCATIEHLLNGLRERIKELPAAPDVGAG